MKKTLLYVYIFVFFYSCKTNNNDLSYSWILENAIQCYGNEYVKQVLHDNGGKSIEIPNISVACSKSKQ
jgi:hypothetical protein